MSSESTTYIDISPYHEILSGMNFILSISVGVVKLTGMVGTGKTRLLGQLQTELRADRQETVLFAAPPKSSKEMQAAITRQFRLNPELPFEQGLARHLIAKSFDQQRLIVIFDDAETISDETLLGIALFRKVLHHDQPLVSIVLCGSETLNARLADPVFAPLVEDTLLSYELNPLSREQLLSFSKACMAAQGTEFDIDAGMLDSLLRESGGLPGAVPALLLGLRAAPPVSVVDSGMQATGSVVVAGSAESSLSADELLITTARSEKIRMDERRKVALKYSAMAASVLAGAFLAWPYISPLLLDNYRALTGAGQQPAAPPQAPLPAPVEAPPAAVITGTESTPAPAASELPAEPVVATEPPAAAELPVPEPVPAVPAAEVAPEVATGVAPAVDEPVVAPPEPAPVIAGAPGPQAPVVAPAPAPAVAPPVPAVATLAPGDGSPASLEAVVRAWLAAWQSQDPDSFFMWYHTDFAPLYQSTLADWRNDRRVKLTRPASIVIGLEEFNVGTRSSLGTTVSFRMTYQSPTYADSTLKEVLIGPDLDGQWRILQEFNREVAVLPTGTRIDPVTLVAAAPASTAPAATTAAQPAPAAPAPAAAPGTAAVPPAVAGPSPRSIAQVQPVQVDRTAAPLASAPAVAVPAEARAAQDPDGIGNFLAAWLTAWQNQDLNGYFQAYHPDYKAPAMASAEAWRNDRTLKITRPAAIVLNMDKLEILESDSRHARVALVLAYHSTHYADRTVKEIELQRSGEGAWIITQERNTLVENLPLVRLLPTDNVATL